MKQWMISLVLIVILFLIALKINWQVKDKVLELLFDFQNENLEVTDKAKIDKVLSEFQASDFQSLDAEYLDFTKSNGPTYKKLIQNLTYYKIQQADLNKKIVGHFRLKKFICKDDYYKDCVLGNEKNIHCIFNPKIFYKTLELMEALEKMGYNKYGFSIVNGHRHPSYNEKVGGAKLSRHIKGEAVDIVVNDINNDGYANKSDKDIILDILENKVIKNQGGIGLYPGTENVHYDVRGKRARWNSY